MNGIGILAYGSLINDPGAEIGPLIVRRIPTETPFPVEYARLSRTRGGAPTVVPHSSGRMVKAEVLVLANSISLAEAKNLLWRREMRKVGSGLAYQESASANAVLICDQPEFCGLDHVLYTDFNASGKISHPHPRTLAEAAVASIATAPLGKDGINYLLDLINVGVETALTPEYVRNVLMLTGAASLEELFDSHKTGTKGSTHDGKS